MLRRITCQPVLIAAAVLYTFLLASCESEPQSRTVQVSTTENPTAAEWIKLESDASLFQYNDTIYVADVSWVDDLELTRGDPVTKVLRQHTDEDSFQNGDANRLEKGTPIHETEERGDILIAATSKGDIRFLQLVEG